MTTTMVLNSRLQTKWVMYRSIVAKSAHSRTHDHCVDERSICLTPARLQERLVADACYTFVCWSLSC